MYYYVVYLAIAIPVILFLAKLIFAILLRGFHPFIPSRPWVVNEIMNELVISQKNPQILALSSGRSGFFVALKKKYPDAVLTGVEPYFFTYIVCVIQNLVRGKEIRIIHKSIYHVNYKDADLVYCHLEPDEMDALGPKLKFECKPGTQVISTGFNIVHLVPKKIVDLPDRKGRLDWLSRNQKLFQAKQKKYRKEKKAYFYEI